jgi:hypothetical protein
MIIPTKMLKPPFKKKGSSGKSERFYSTDAGIFNLAELVELTGIKRCTLYDRINRNWQNPAVFDPRNGQCSELAEIFKEKNVVPREKTGLELLSGRDRFKNLQKIKTGTWEARYL